MCKDNLRNIKNKINILIEEYANINKKKPAFIPGESPIPVSGKIIDENELKFMVDATLDGWLTTGRFNDLFEKKLSTFLGIKHVHTVNSGSSANLVAFSTLTSEVLGDRAIKVGDEVITVAAGFPTTINPILQFGAIPVFVDIDIKTHNINVEKIEQAISSKTKAIMLAHSLGNPFNLKVIIEICRKYKLWLIEDNCDALGSKYNNQLTGTFGDISTLSFYPAHHITMGEGGAVLTNNSTLSKIIKSYRDWGRDCYCDPGRDNTCGKRFEWKLGTLPEGYDHKYIYNHMGYNLKITDMQAACGLGQLNKLEKFIESRKNNFSYLYNRLKTCSDFFDLPVATNNSDPSWFGFLLTIKPDTNIRRVDLLKYLEQEKIGTRLLFAGNLVRQPYMKNKKFIISEELINTDIVMNNSFWIGVYPGLNNEMLDYTVDKIETFVGLNF